MPNEDAMNEEDPFHDRLDDVDREIRLNKLRRALEDAGAVLPLADDDLPPDVEEAFLENVLAFETAPKTTYAKRLLTASIWLPSPDSLSSKALTEKLKEVVHGLAQQQTYLSHTNHLSDLELYRMLWETLLNLDTADVPLDPDAAVIIDILGGGTEQDLHLYLRHYATEEDRLVWEGQLEGPIPKHEAPPFNRDQHLPQPPFED
jgi:hypothetical protein